MIAPRWRRRSKRRTACARRTPTFSSPKTPTFITIPPMPKLRTSSYAPYLLAAVALLLLVHGVSGAEEGAPAAGAPEKTLYATIMEGSPLIKAVWLAIIATSITMVTFIVQGMMTLQKGKLAPIPLVES